MRGKPPEKDSSRAAGRSARLSAPVCGMRALEVDSRRAGDALEPAEPTAKSSAKLEERGVLRPLRPAGEGGTASARGPGEPITNRRVAGEGRLDGEAWNSGMGDCAGRGVRRTWGAEVVVLRTCKNYRHNEQMHA